MARRYVTNGTLPASPEEVADALSDPVKAAKLFGNEADWRRFQDAYAARMNADGAIDAQLAEAARLRNGGGRSPVDFSPGQGATRVAMRSPVAPGAHLNGVFTNLGELIQAGALDHPTAEVASKLSQLSNSFGSTVPADGGFLIPETLRSDIASLALESAIVRPRATVMPMGSLRLGIPAIDDTSHASSVLGGLVGYWTEEGASLTESQASFERVVLEAKKLVIYGEIPNELMADSPALDAWLRVALPSATAFYEDVAFMNGSGVGEPLGFYKAAAMISVGATLAAHVKWTDVANLYSRMLPDSLSRAVWIASPGAIPDLLKMVVIGTEGANTVGGPALIGYGAGGQAAPTSILGRPLIFSEKAPDLGSAFPLAFVDLAYYLVGDRQQMALTVSEHYRFQNDKTAIRVIERVDGRPWLNSALTPRNGSSSTLSAFVGLAAS
jgi:HK97 family phage major capsid protein